MSISHNHRSSPLIPTAASLTALLLIAGPGCDKETATPAAEEAEVTGETKTEIPDEEEIKKEVASGVDDVIKKRAPKWKFEYSGDLKGTVEGGIMSVVSVGKNTTIAGGAMTKDRKGKAPQSFTAQIMRYGDTPQVQMKLTLPDGMECRATPGEDTATVDVADGDRKTFRATVKGALTCGEAKDKKIKYTATLNKKP